MFFTPVFSTTSNQEATIPHEPIDIIFKTKPGLQESLSDDQIPKNLSSPEQILCKYQHKLLPHGKIGELAVKLAKEAYFGEAVMKKCTVMGHRDRPGLPTKTLTQLKRFLFNLTTYIDCWADPALFECHWAGAHDKKAEREERETPTR